MYKGAILREQGRYHLTSYVVNGVQFLAPPAREDQVMLGCVAYDPAVGSIWGCMKTYLQVYKHARETPRRPLNLASLDGFKMTIC